MSERRAGRRPRAEAPSLPVPVRLSPAERAQLQQAAAVNRQTVSEFARDALVIAAQDCLDESYLKRGALALIRPGEAIITRR